MDVVARPQSIAKDLTAALPRRLASSDPGDELRVQRRIRVATTDNAADLFTTEAFRLREHCPEREGPSRLSLEIRQSEEQSHSFLDLIFRHLDHARQPVAENFPVPLAKAKHPRPIGDRVGFIRLRNDMPRAKRFGG